MTSGAGMRSLEAEKNRIGFTPAKSGGQNPLKKLHSDFVRTPHFKSPLTPLKV
jgi:hypothetical protein